VTGDSRRGTDGCAAGMPAFIARMLRLRSGLGHTGRIEFEEGGSNLHQRGLERDRVRRETACRRPETARRVVKQVAPDLEQSALYLGRHGLLAEEKPVLTLRCQDEQVRVEMTVTGAKAIQAQHFFAGHQDRACGAPADTGNCLPEDLKLESWPSIDPSNVPAAAPVGVGHAIPGEPGGPAADEPTPESDQERARRPHAGEGVVQ